MNRRALGAVAALATVVSCAELFDEPAQCKADRDCERFDAVCDVSRGVCVARSDGQDGGRDDRSNPQPDDNSVPEAAAPDDRCNVSPKPTGTIGTRVDGAADGEITTATTLGCDKDWVLDGRVFVRSGATLTVAAGTTIRAKKGTGAALVVAPGARILAEGRRDQPIVMTSDDAAPAAGDWLGVLVLGLAPPSGQGPYLDRPEFTWGGANEEDDSGVLSFLRIEYADVGLSLAGVGRRTKIDSVEVRRTVANCFTFYGGRADAKHLVCQSPGRHQFFWQVGATGRAQFLFGQKSPPPPIWDSEGILVDNGAPTIFNATICGDKPAGIYGYGLVFADNATVTLNGAIVTGWRGGFDARGGFRAPPEIRSSIFFDNANNPAFVETPSETNADMPTFDDDNGFDEIAFFNDPSRANATNDPQLVDCIDAKSPKPWPKSALLANAPAPPSDGFFDPDAKYIGALKDEADPWMKGAWIRFDDK